MTETTYAKPQIPLTQVREFLEAHHGAAISGLEILAGGFWSQAYRYQQGDNDLVLRLGGGREGYDIDKAARRFLSPGLPIPEVLAVGEAFDGSFAVSRRLAGHFLETRPVSQRDAVNRALLDLLAALRSQRGGQDAAVEWYLPNETGAATWQSWLRLGLGEAADGTYAPWRAEVAANAELNDLFTRCLARIESLYSCLPQNPERRDLVHSDLLHQNVLVDDDATQVTGIFSWKCSALGDFLYDVAWCTFWWPWHPVLAPDRLWSGTLAATDLTADDLQHAAQRHHCYELQIAASHMGWFVTQGETVHLQKLVQHLESIYQQGPREI